MQYTMREYEAIWAIQESTKYTYVTGATKLASERKHLETDERTNAHRLTHHSYAESFHEAFERLSPNPVPMGIVLFSGEGH
jgi:hypothetical protein